MIEKRMLDGSSQIQPQPQKRPRRRAPIGKKVCNTEPIQGVLPPEPDRLSIPEWMRVKDGYFAWEPLDSDDDSDEGEGVICSVEERYFSLMAARKESRESFKQQEEEKQTSNKPRKGQWFYVYKGDMIQHQCRMCLKQDHSSGFCPYINYVPKGAKVGPGYVVVCRCCGEEGGHDGDNWVGRAIARHCMNCRASAEHDTQDCPKERRLPQEEAA